MAEYIEREAVIKKFKERCTKCDARFDDPLCLQCSGRSDLETVCDLPAADVAPVIHAEWKDNGLNGYAYAFICSKCGYIDGYPFNDRLRYCPHCGAKMDGGDGNA